MAHQRQCDTKAEDLTRFIGWLLDRKVTLCHVPSGDGLTGEEVIRLCHDFETEVGASAPIEKTFDPDDVVRWVQTHFEPRPTDPGWMPGPKTKAAYYQAHGATFSLYIYLGKPGKSRGADDVPKAETVVPDIGELRRLMNDDRLFDGSYMPGNGKYSMARHEEIDLACEMGVVDYDGDYQHDDYVIVIDPELRIGD